MSDDGFHDGNYYQSPEANMLRRMAAEQEKRHQADMGVIDSLIASLTPADSAAELFTFVEMYTWGLIHWKKRPRS